MKTDPLTEKQLNDLNPGIRSTVKQLREWGYQTCDSGDGQTHKYECDLPHAYVHIKVDPANLTSETDRLVGLLKESGVEIQMVPPDESDALIPQMEAVYLPTHGLAFLHLFNVVLP